VLTLVALLIGFYLAEGAGYLVHRLAHWPGSGPLHRAHMAHHLDLYPDGGSAFLSEAYQHPPARSGNVLHFVPFVLGLGAVLLLVLPLGWALLLFAEVAILALTNSVLHDRLHVREDRLEGFAWFERLRALHRQHHDDMTTNLGIFHFGIDRLFGTLRDPSRRAPDQPPR